MNKQPSITPTIPEIDDTDNSKEWNEPTQIIVGGVTSSDAIRV